MNDAVARTLIIFFIAFGFALLINLYLSIREKKTDVWARTLGWIVVLPIFILSAYFGGIYFLVVVMLMTVIGVLEFYFLAEHTNIKVFKVTGTIFSASLPLVAFFGDGKVYEIAIILFSLFILAIPIYKRQVLNDLSADIHSSATTLLGIIYIGWTLSYLILIRNLENGFNYFLYFYFLILANDISSYYAGKFFGKSNIFQQISPSKTLEGSLGGIAGTIFVAFLLRYLVPTFNYPYIFLLSAIVAVFGEIGDLVESSLKREAQVKDAGRLLPGFGGILDRFDSLIYALPIVYFFLVFVKP